MIQSGFSLYCDMYITKAYLNEVLYASEAQPKVSLVDLVRLIVSINELRCISSQGCVDVFKAGYSDVFMVHIRLANMFLLYCVQKYISFYKDKLAID